MMTSGHHKGRIFLSHPHTKNGFFFLNTTKNLILYWKNLKDFQKNRNTLRCDIVTSFFHYNDVTDRRAASVRLFVFYLFLGLVWVCEINRIHHWCSEKNSAHARDEVVFLSDLATNL